VTAQAPPRELSELEQAIVARITRPDYRRFEAQLRSSGYCARPVRLRGSVQVCDGHGARRQVWSTDGEPDELLRKACGNRREAICGPCAAVYRADAWQLVAAGLRGGKGVPETVTGHPAVFATLTAPSFGAVHAHVLGPDGQPVRCRPRRDAPVCPHGNPLGCSKIHGPDDPCLGEPLCAQCFDYDGAVIWNSLLGELWRRTMIYLPRKLAKLTQMTQKRLHELVSVSYAKVSEYQHRGLVHLHPVIRLDRRMPTYRKSEIRAPDKRFTTGLLEQALRDAVADVKTNVPDELGDGDVRWGTRLDVQQLSSDEEPRRQRASYLAKYSTKSTEQAGGLLYRVTAEDVEHVKVRPHVRNYMRSVHKLHAKVSKAIAAAAPAESMSPPAPAPAPTTSEQPNGVILRVLAAMSTSERVLIRLHDASAHVGCVVRRSNGGLVLDDETAIQLAEVRAITTPQPATKRDRRDRRLAQCAHAFGYRGHCLTKSRHYSTTFGQLRQDRADHIRQQLLARGDAAQRTLAQVDPSERITDFEFVGVGHLTSADAVLAAQAAARAREDRELAREALYDHHNRGREGRCEAPQDQTGVGL
jgi:hypothetical protein